MPRTRIKICGLTRAEDVAAAVASGADALGFVFYPPSPRHVTVEWARELMLQVPPFVTVVGLFVNIEQAQLKQICEHLPLSLLQFHGDETPEQCAKLARAVGKPFIRALRVRDTMVAEDLIEYEKLYRQASVWFAGLLLDTYVDSYGGSGKVFDWALIPNELALQAVLSGGLNEQNVTEAVARVRPYAVDVSSGVEASKGIKDPARMQAFCDAVRKAGQ